MLLSFYPRVFVLLLARVAAITTMTPFFGERSDRRIKVLLAVVIAIALLPVVPPEWADAAMGIRTLPQMVLALLNELMLGAVVALVVRLFEGACSYAGSVMSRDCGLAMGRTIDPFNGASVALMEQMLRMLFVIMVLVTGAHLQLLKLVADSLLIIPPISMSWLDDGLARLGIYLGSRMFVMALQFALPLMASGFIVNSCFGMITRLAPEFNVLFLSMPVRLSAGIFFFGWVLRYGEGTYSRLIEGMLQNCYRVLT